MKTHLNLKVALDAGELRSTASLLVAMAIGLENVDESPDVNNTTIKEDGEVVSFTDICESVADSAGPDVSQTADVVTISGVELDKLGLPWDERINTDSKLKTKKDEVWKLKRNLDKDFVEQVRAELRAAMAAPGVDAAPLGNPESAATNKIDYEAEAAEIEATETTAPPPPAPEPGTTAPPPPAPEVETVTKYITDDGNEFTRDELLAAGWNEGQIAERETVEYEVEPETAPETTTTETSDEMTFPILMSHITPAIAGGTLTNEQVNAAVVKQGLPSLQLLAARPDLIGAVFADLFPAG